MNEYSIMCYHFWLEKKERAYQLISQQIPEGKVLQRNKLFVKCSFTNQSSSLKMIDRWNVRMFVRLQPFGTLAPETLATGTLGKRTLAFGTLAPETHWEICQKHCLQKQWVQQLICQRM